MMKTKLHEFQGEWLSFKKLQEIVKIKTKELKELIEKAESGDRSLNHLLILRNHDKEINKLTSFQPKKAFCRKCKKPYKRDSAFNCYCKICKNKMDKIYVSPMEQ